MSRIRSIKPQFFTDDEIAALQPLARLLFIGLWTEADREGRLEDRPKQIKARVLPFDDVDVEALLAELAEARFIVRYAVGERRYIAVRSFVKHQHVHVREPASTIPALGAVETGPVQEPVEPGAGTVQEPDEHRSGPLVSGLLSLVSGLGNGEGEVPSVLAPASPVRLNGPPAPSLRIEKVPDDFVRVWVDAERYPKAGWLKDRAETGALRALIDEHGSEETLRRWRVYCADAKSFYTGHPPTKFAKDFDKFGGNAKTNGNGKPKEKTPDYWTEKLELGLGPTNGNQHNLQLVALACRELREWKYDEHPITEAQRERIEAALAASETVLRGSDHADAPACMEATKFLADHLRALVAQAACR